MSRISKAEVSRIRVGLGEKVAAFRGRTVGDVEFLDISLDAATVRCMVPVRAPERERPGQVIGE